MRKPNEGFQVHSQVHSNVSPKNRVGGTGNPINIFKQKNFQILFLEVDKTCVEDQITGCFKKLTNNSEFLKKFQILALS